MKQLGGTDLKRLHRSWRERTEGRLALVLDAVQTPWNTGAIVRTAAALRVDHLWLASGATSPRHPRSQKTSLGTERYLEWTETETGVAAVSAARDAGYQVVAIELAEGAVPLPEAELTRHVCLVIGHEDHGVSAAALEAADLVAYIPQLGKVGSLNVAAAATIALYEVRRREWVT
ncbi:MAG TPA: TrmH family RNA methyltransferase [Acidimicrobiales bacterium]|nr:TrmH family RNA methyltransferase [Acidimicrobiales bacterium]